MPKPSCFSTTLGTAFITGGGGYLTARIQGKVALAASEGENKRLRTQHAEDHLRNRQTTYHHLLNVAWRYNAVVYPFLWDLREPEDEDQFRREFSATMRAYRESFLDLINGVRLFAPESVRLATDELGSAYAELEEERLTGSLTQRAARRRSRRGCSAPSQSLRTSGGTKLGRRWSTQ